MFVLVIIAFCFFCGVGISDGQDTDQTPAVGIRGTKCYDDFRRPQRCIPEFQNAAFGLLMDATNTCGERAPTEYCEQTGTSGTKLCEVCLAGQHDARYLTDRHHQDKPTWWQSETMLEGVQWPNQVNLTLKFGKSFDITYVRLWFWSPRPESFFISKKTTEDGPWIPYQYYSSTCRDTYGLPDDTYTRRGNEAKALCTSEYSDISPLRGGNVAFGTLEGRPSAYNFDATPELQEWVTATEIMITLDRLNTFRDEVFGDEQVLKSYFYAIADVAVGARCRCNGHASECLDLVARDGSRRKACRCEHNTAGPDCNECLPFYNDAPWGRANATDAHECKQCNCNGYSNRCYFDQALYDQTGHGGHCLDCTANRDGPNCERCRDNYYMREDGYCISCDCDPIGSRNLQCNQEGTCQCKTGVVGPKCDRCAADHYDFSNNGCKPCGCSEAGSVGNVPSCNTATGECFCKENVEGKRCQECKPGYFNLDGLNRFGCTPCFCFGHSSQCKSAPGYAKFLIESLFFKGAEGWKAEDQFNRNIDVTYNSFTHSISVKGNRDEIVYFVAPYRFLGDQRASYNQLLEFTLRTGEDRPIPSAMDVILEGNGRVVSNTIFSQQNRMPSTQDQKYMFRLHEHPEYGWQPKMPSISFISLLTNLTAIKIKGTYAPEGVGFLSGVKLETAVRGLSGDPALWMEICDCPTGYVGQFCESCSPGFKHYPALGGAFKSCVPCDCNNHSTFCDSETGRCKCEHNTTGDNCELCARGFYGNALAGTANDCLPCGCREGGPCIQIDDDVVMCTECPTGYTGHKCDSCSDGYYGDPLGKLGSPTQCQLCNCNGNVDPNAIGNCNTTTGECLKCVYNTGGPKCDACLAGFYGNALALPKGDCKPCECYPLGTEQDTFGATVCDQTTGACTCKHRVVGKNCDQCEDGYYNLHSGDGCLPCNCDPIGSFNQTCNMSTGQCYCRPGVTGLRCDHCESRKYGFSFEGCKGCECDPTGSKELQCDATGQCPCFDNVEGRKCDQCKENKYDRHRGCIDCPECYHLVQKAAKEHNEKLTSLDDILEEIENQPTVITDEEFPERLRRTKSDINGLFQKIKNATGANSLSEQMLNIRQRSEDLSRTLSELEENIYSVKITNDVAETNIDHADDVLEEATEKLSDIKAVYETEGVDALEEVMEKAKFVGQQSQKMTDIAQEARHISDSLTTKSDEIVKKASAAKDISITAYSNVKSAFSKQAAITEALRNIKYDVSNTEIKLNKSRDWITEVCTKAEEVNKNALALLSEVKNLAVPQINIVELKEKSEQLKQKAYRLSNRTEDIFKECEMYRKTAEDNSITGKELLNAARNQQDEINDLRNDLVFCDSQANGAINLWNDILEGAKTNYKLLAEFDTQTQKSKIEAEEALRSIIEIEEIIYKIEADTAYAQANLDEARKNTDSAFDKAEQANQLAKSASEKAEHIKIEAEQLFQNTSSLSEEADLLFDRVINTEGELKNLVEQAKSNESFVQDAKEKVGRAEKNTESVSKKVRSLLSNVEAIMAELHNSADINEMDVKRLEEEIERTERRIKEARLDERLEELQKEHDLQNELKEQYKVQIAILQTEVDGIERIVKALPDDCFKHVELEP